MIQTKVCCACKECVAVELFSKKGASKDGYSSKCKKCHNEYVRNVWYPKNTERHINSVSIWKKENKTKVLATRHSVPEESVIKILKKDTGRCHICDRADVELVFDHCHRTSRGRGMLCTRCNLLLGNLGDSYESVKDTTNKILRYLSKSVTY